MALPTTTRQPMHETMSYDPNVQKQIADINKVKPKTPQQECKERGGVWDEKTQTCVMIKPQEAKQTPEGLVKQQVQEKGGYIDETGKYIPPTTPMTHVTYNNDGTVTYTTKEGQTYELTKEEYRALQPRGEGLVTQNVAEIQAIEGGAYQQAQEALQLQQVGETPFIPDNRQVVADQGIVAQGATLASMIGGGVAGAKGGALIGAFLGPAGATAGAVLGATFGAIGAGFGVQKLTHMQSTKEALGVFTQADKNQKEIKNFVNLGIISQDEARRLWENEQNNIYSAQAYLKRATQNDLTNFLGSPGDELIKVNRRIALDREYRIAFEQALLNPNPNAVEYLNENI